MGRIFIVLLSLSLFGVAQTDQAPFRELEVDILDSASFSQVEKPYLDYFEVKLDGKPVRVLSAERGMRHPKVAVVLDLTGSMHFPWMWNTAFEGATRMIESLAYDVDLTVLVMRDGNNRVIATRSGAKFILNELAKERSTIPEREAGTATRLRDTVVDAIQMARLSHGDAVVAITDAGDNASKTGYGKLGNVLAERGVRLFGLVPARDFAGQTLEESTGMDDLQTLSEESGGADIVLHRPDLRDIHAASNRIVNSIRRPLVMKLAIPESSMGKFSLKYRDKRQSVRLLAPKRLVPKKGRDLDSSAAK